jgi:SWIM zinc finger
MDMRELKGLEIAARAKIVYDGKAWSVPSQTSPTGAYHVLLTPAVSCTCEDFQRTNKPCKHVIAARLVRERNGDEQDDGEFHCPRVERRQGVPVGR